MSDHVVVRFVRFDSFLVDAYVPVGVWRAFGVMLTVPAYLDQAYAQMVLGPPVRPEYGERREDETTAGGAQEAQSLPGSGIGA